MTDKDPLIGKTLEKCRLIGKLGTGGMGSVYLAEHFGLGRKVAVKILPPDMSRDPEYVARFMREATTAGRLEHPNIVQIYDVGYAEDRHFIVMQFVEGESLSTAVEALGAMESHDAARVVVGVLRGLHHAHEHGVVHRDVKPDNILLAKGDQPKLLDFGLAIETEGALQLTKDGLVVGTPYYLSPEQARGQRATPLSDVYATGVLLYYLVTGKRPFVGATALAVLNKHIREKPASPRSLNPKVPKALNDIILKMMSKAPEDRYPSAGAAGDDLENFLADRPVTARIVEAPAWLTPPVRIAGAAAAAFLVLVLIITVSIRSCRKPPEIAQPPPGTGTPGPVATPEPPPVGDLDRIVKYDLDNRDTPAAWRGILNDYDAYIKTNRGTRHADNARPLRAEFLAHLERQAQKTLDRLPSDPVQRNQAMNTFPPEILDLTSAGERVRAEKARLADVLRKRFAEQKVQLDRCMEEGDFETAAAYISEMLRYADADRQKELLSLRAELPERERRHNNAALRKLSQDYAQVRARLGEALTTRDFEAAWRHATGFLSGCKETSERTLTRAPGLNYDGLILPVTLSISIDADQLAMARQEVERAWTSASADLPFQVLSDLQDALDIAWILKRAGSALKTLSSASGGEVTLATFGATGRVSMGPDGLAFRPRGGADQALSVNRLVPADLVLLAAKAENQTPEAANAPLARAAGVVHLYSAAADRYPGAARWFARAAELRAPMPSGRAEAVRELGRRQVRETLALAQKDVADRRFAAAKKALAELEAQAAGDKALAEEVGTVSAAVLTAELKEAFGGNSSARVKELARLLRDRYPGLYDEDAVADLHRRTLWTTASWLRTPMELASGYWDWEGKSKNAPAPAAFQAHDGIRLEPGKRLLLNPARAGTVTGLRAQVRLNPAAKDKGFTAGFLFDVDAAAGRYRTLVITPDQVGFGEGTEVGARLRHAVPLKKKPAAGEWIDLAFLAEGGDIVAYLGDAPVVGFRGDPAPKLGMGLISDADVNFRAVQVRK
jgi:tRNA A-37 threonylcarbamoyl transferase component Bud32